MKNWIFFGTKAIWLLLAALIFLATPSRAQTYTNFTVTISANQLRDRFYDASTSAALMQNQIQAAVLHLMSEASSLNPGVLSASNSLAVMQNVISDMTNAIGSNPQMTLMDLTSVALPYFQTELSKVLPANTVNTIQNGLGINIIAEQQGLYSAVYSNITTTLPSGSIFSGVENTASGLQTLQRQAASEVATLALPQQIRNATDGAFGQAAAQLASQITSITPQDTLNTIVQNVPALQNSPFLQNLAQTAQNAGQVVTDVNSLLGEATNAIGTLSQSISNNINLLGQISLNQSDVFNSLTNIPVINNSKLIAEQIQTNFLSGIASAQPTITFLSTIISDVGDPQLGQQVATVGSAAVKIASAINQFAGNGDVGNGILSFSSALATGNLLGAALGVFSMFIPAGPTPEQQILTQINVIQKDIAQLSSQISAGFTQINSRFDQVDTALTNILNQINSNMTTINTDFSYVDNNLSQIRGSLLDLQGQVQRLQSQTYDWLTAIDQENLYLLLHNSIGYENNVGQQMVYTGNAPDDFVSFEGEYWLWAVQNSVNGLYQPSATSYTVSGLNSQLTTQTAPEENLTYINNFIANNLGLPKPYGGSLANPRVWSIAANGLSEMCVENPTYFRQDNGVVGDLGNVIQIGNNINTFVNNLVAFNTNAPNTNLWIAACNGYRSALTGFTNAVLTDINQFDIASNYPAGFNPFTNQFLSLITSPATTMTDGPYGSASVVSVSAMACSPTSDGMPIYFLDANALRRLDATGMITTLAGGTNAGFEDGPSALLNNPQALAVATNGNVYIADTDNHAIRVYYPIGQLSTLVGYPPGPSNSVPVSGAMDGTNGSALFNFPRGVIMDNQGNLLVADTGNHCIRKITTSGVATTYAGQLGGGQYQISNLPQIWAPTALTIASNGVVYILNTTPQSSRIIESVDTNGMVSVYQPTNGLMPFLFAQSLTGNSSVPPNQAFGSYGVAMTSGANAPTVVNANGTVEAWGNDNGGQCNVPTGLSSVVEVSAHQSGFTMALMANGQVAAWGYNGDGECNVPAGLNNVVAISNGEQSGLALENNGTVAAWGYNGDGECNVPTGLSNVEAVTCLSECSMALKSDGTVVAWGNNLEGQCNVPDGLNNIVSISNGGLFGLALKTDGTVVAWGDNTYGECNVPGGLSNVVAVASGIGNIFCVALKADGTVAAWGDNHYEQCNVPVGLSNVVAVLTGNDDTLALKADGTVVAWGLNNFTYDGQTYGDGQCNVPTGLNNVVAVESGDFVSMALKANGQMVVWGDNTYGECNIPAPTLPQQTADTLVANAAVQGFTAGVITPDIPGKPHLARPGRSVRVRLAGDHLHPTGCGTDPDLHSGEDPILGGDQFALHGHHLLRGGPAQSDQRMPHRLR